MEHLKEVYAEALSHPDISGISIGTRPDCVDEAILDHLASLAEQHFVTLELGLESCSDETLKRVNRGHDFLTSLNALEMAAQRNIRTGAHFILGLPGESKAYLIEQINTINRLPLHSIKFHQLQIMKGTQMEQEYRQNPLNFHLWSLEEYINLICDLLERLRPDLYIERLAGEVPPRFLVVQPWELIRNDEVIRRIEKRLAERDTYQGKLYSHP
jgi:radical SAM protein (TIGR01212 family)